MRFFTYLRTGEEFKGRKKNYPDLLLNFAAGNQFSQRGIEQDDLVYIWSFIKGHLYLLGRMQVEDIYTELDVKRLHPQIANNYTFWASEHIVAVAGSATTPHFDLEVPADVINQLRFAGNKAPKRKNTPLSNDFDPQTFRGVRELMPSSASLLDKILKAHCA
ncbi:MAG TPA: hypothetical protein VF600_11320 [Abditibacteriaceae bacterium]|jgi:hypothetical protein